MSFWILKQMEVSIFVWVYRSVDRQKKYRDAPIHWYIAPALVKREIQSSNSVSWKRNKCEVTYITTCIQCRLDTLLNLPFKATFLIYNFILNTNKRYLVFVMSSFVLNITFCSMLSIFELFALFMYGRFLSASAP